MITHIESLADYEELINNTNVIIDMYADWCGPCKRIAPDFEKLSNEYLHIEFAKLNVDDMGGMGLPLDEPRGIPYFVIIHNKQVVKTITGANLAAVIVELDKLPK